MGAADVGGTQLTVALVARGTLRAQCLARFLELSGFNIRIFALEKISREPA